jgi:hypothetical protein
MLNSIFNVLVDEVVEWKAIHETMPLSIAIYLFSILFSLPLFHSKLTFLGIIRVIKNILFIEGSINN